jgi:hypothetical protein
MNQEVAVRRRWSSDPVILDTVVPLAIFFLGRLVSAALLTHLAAEAFDPVSGDRREGATGSSLPGIDYASVITYWDGAWYERIAREGYPANLPRGADGEVIQNPWAFFPIYPALAGLLMRAGLEFPLAASVISLVSAAAAMVLLHRLLHPTLRRFTSLLTVGCLSWGPVSPIFQTAYAESLALLLILTTFWLVRMGRYGRAVAAVVVLSLTRPVTAPMAGVMAVLWILRWRNRSDVPFPIAERRGHATVVVVAGTSSALWPAVCAVVTGEPDGYALTQQSWLFTERWTPWLFSAASMTDPTRTLMVLALLGLCVWVAARDESRAWGTDLRLWVMFNTIFVLAVSQASSSVYRYLMVGVVLAWPTPEVSQGLKRWQSRAALVTCLLMVMVLLQYGWIRAFYTSGTLPP